MKRFVSQSLCIPAPTITETNTPDQHGRVIVVTGGYAGVGLELSKILYAHNATVYVAGRSKAKAEAALAQIRSATSHSNGRVEFMHVDFCDLHTIKAGVQDFLAKEKRLDVLVNNAGVMFPPAGSKDSHGEELQLGTNCVGPWLLYKLLTPILAATATSAPTASVRVTWAGSTGLDLFSPKPGGMNLESSGRPKDVGVYGNYGQSKVGNLYFAREESRRTAESKVVHLCFNPGNLKTELQRHGSALERKMAGLMLYPAIYGAYTELWAAISPDVKPEHSGSYVWPWGKFGDFRPDIEGAMKSEAEGGTGLAAKFISWCDERVQEYIF